MTKFLRVSDEAHEYIAEQAELNHRSVLGDQLNAMIEELGQWRSGDRFIDRELEPASRGIIESEKPRMADTPDANPNPTKEVIEP